MLDLGATVKVAKVKLFNQNGEAKPNLQGVAIWIGDDSSAFGANTEAEANLDVPGTGGLEVVVGKKGRYLWVVKPGQNVQLAVCGIEVWGASRQRIVDASVKISGQGMYSKSFIMNFLDLHL